MRRLVFDQSSPVHPVSESRGGPLSVTEHERTKEILMSNIGYRDRKLRGTKKIGVPVIGTKKGLFLSNCTLNPILES